MTRSFTREQIPYYYREGAIVPLYPRIMHLKERPETLILQFAPGKSGEFNFYEDAGNSVDYDTACTFTRITQRSEKGKTVCTIYPRTGAFDGMPQARAYRLELLAREKAPSKVTLNGTATDYEYDAAGKKVIVLIPRTACDRKLVVTVQ